jgi:hypothetical protein
LENDKYRSALQILDMTAAEQKQKYRQLCLTESLPIFIQDWWWDALCGNDWDVFLVEKDGVIQAAMPYRTQRKYGFQLMTKPPFTIYNEPYMQPCKSAKQYDLYQHQFQHLQAIFQLVVAKKLNIKLQFSPDITHTIALHQLGFQLEHQYTHIIHPRDEQSAWEQLNRNVKRNIVAAQKNINISLSDNYATIYQLLKLVFQKSNAVLDLSFEQFERLDQACVAHQARKIIVAQDENNRIKAFVYLVWDNKKIYLLMSGGEAADLKSGVMQLLYWEAIKEAITQQKTLDFDGSALSNVEAIIRSFGGVRSPKTMISYFSSSILKAINYLKN